MKSRQENKLKMYLALRIFLKTNTGVLGSLPNINVFIAALDRAIEQIMSNSQQQQFVMTSVTLTKNNIRAELSLAVVDASNKMQAYARYIKDSSMLNDVKITISKMKEATDMQVIAIARGLHGKIESLIDDVAAYLLTPESQRALEAKIAEFQAAISNTMITRVGHKENTRLVNEGFELGDEAVDNISALMEIVRMTNDLLYANYRNTIKVIGGGGSLQVKGQAIDALTGRPLEDVTLTFMSKDGREIVLVKKTAEKGGFFVKNLDEGVYEVLAEKTGYVPQTVQATVTPDVLCEVNVVMVRV